VGMFERLQQASRLNDDGAFPYLRSHPLTTERIADMRARLALEPAPTDAAAPVSVLWHRLMAERARVLAERNPDNWQTWWRHGQQPQATALERYTAALAAWRLGRPTDALDLAQRLATEPSWRNDPAVQQVLLHWRMELWLAQPAAQRRAHADVLVWREAGVRSPARAGRLLGAQVALHTGAGAAAESSLRSWVVDHPRDAAAWQLLSQVHDAQGHALRARRAQAEARVAQGDWSGAAEVLRAAQALPKAVQDSDTLEQAIIHSRLREVRERLREVLRDEAAAR